MGTASNPQPDKQLYELLAILDMAIDHLSTLRLYYALRFLENYPISLVKPTDDLGLYPTILAPALSPKLQRYPLWLCGVRQIIVTGQHTLTSEADRLKLIMNGNAMAQSKPFLVVEAPLSLPGPVSDDTNGALAYDESVAELLTISQRTGVPLFSCILNPDNTDLITLSTTLMDFESELKISDAGLLHPFMEPNQRTQVFVRSVGSNQELGFTYLKLQPDLIPTRIEFPIWLYRAGQLDSILRLVISSKFLGVYNPPYLDSQPVNKFMQQMPTVAPEEP